MKHGMTLTVMHRNIKSSYNNFLTYGKHKLLTFSRELKLETGEKSYINFMVKSFLITIQPLNFLFRQFSIHNLNRLLWSSDS